MTKKYIVSSISVSFSIFSVQLHAHNITCATIIINDSIDDQGSGPSQFNFRQPIYMCNSGEIKFFCSESRCFRPSSNLFMNVMQLPGAGFTTWHSATGPALGGKTVFWSSPIFGMKILRKSPKCLEPHAM